LIKSNHQSEIRRSRTVLFNVLLLLVLLGNDADGLQKAAASDDTPQRVWIYLKPEAVQWLPGPAYTARSTNRPESEVPARLDPVPDESATTLIEQNVLRVRFFSRSLQAFSAEATKEQVGILAGMPQVQKIDYVKTLVRIPQDEMQVEIGGPRHAKASGALSDQHLEQLNILRLHARGITGRGVRIGLIDTGYYKRHAAFRRLIDSGRLIAERDFIFDDNDTDDEDDGDITFAYRQSSHGTAVWGLIAAYDSATYYGAAYDAEFLLAKTERYGSENRTDEDDFVAGVEWCERHGAAIISVSLGYREMDNYTYKFWEMDGKTTVTARAANWAFERGILLVASAGNEGQESVKFPDGGLGSPADAFGALAVGAVDANGTLWSYSSFGPTYDGRTKPELCARGFQTNYVWNAGETSYTYGNGTSLAAPLIAGSAALVLQAHPKLRPAEIMAALKMYASRSAVPDRKYGWGIPNVFNSVFKYKSPERIGIEVGRREIATYPNPAKSNVNFYFVWHRAVPVASDATLTVYDLQGKLVYQKRLASDYYGRDAQIAWDLVDNQGCPVPAGVYLVRLQNSAYNKTGKFLILR